MYMKAIYLGESGDGLQTGIGAEFETPEETKAAFESIRPHEKDIEKATFIIDLHDENHDIVDTIGINGKSYTQITGQPVLTAEEYAQIDKDYWQAAEKIYKQFKTN